MVKKKMKFCASHNDPVSTILVSTINILNSSMMYRTQCMLAKKKM